MKHEELYKKAVAQYEAMTPQGKKAFGEARGTLAGGETRSLAYFYPHPIFVERAKGSTLWDVDGNTYLDFLNNYTSMLHGHAHPYIEEEMVKALKKGTGVTAVLPEQAELGRILCERIPGVERVRFCNSGTEAVMFAVRTARAIRGCDKIIKMEGGYHGTTDMMEYNVSPPAPQPGMSYHPECVPESKGISVKAGEDLIFAPFNDLDIVEDILKTQAKNVAGILVEPVMGVAGFIGPKPGYLEGLRSLADQYGVLLIFDEVQTLRLSTGGAQKRFGVTPDLTAMAKIIGGGLPVGAFGGRKKYMEVFDSTKEGSLSQSGTFNGARAVMAGGIAAMELFDEPCAERLETASDHLAQGIEAAIKKNGIPASLARTGSMMQVHFTPEIPTNYAETLNPYMHLNKLFHMLLVLKGVYIAPRGAWALSTVVTEQEIGRAVSAVDETLYEMKNLF